MPSAVNVSCHIWSTHCLVWQPTHLVGMVKLLAFRVNDSIRKSTCLGCAVFICKWLWCSPDVHIEADWLFRCACVWCRGYLMNTLCLTVTLEICKCTKKKKKRKTSLARPRCFLGRQPGCMNNNARLL